VEPGMLEMGLPVDPAEVINLTELMSRTGLGETPESLLRNGFVVYRPFYTTDNLDRSTENGQSL